VARRGRGIPGRAPAKARVRALNFENPLQHMAEILEQALSRSVTNVYEYVGRRELSRW